METPDVETAVTVRAAHNANICQHEDGKSGGVLIGLQVENVESFKLKMGLEPVGQQRFSRTIRITLHIFFKLEFDKK